MARFARARALRLIPGLWLMLTAVLFVGLLVYPPLSRRALRPFDDRLGDLRRERRALAVVRAISPPTLDGSRCCISGRLGSEAQFYAAFAILALAIEKVGRPAATEEASSACWRCCRSPWRFAQSGSDRARPSISCRHGLWEFFLGSLLALSPTAHTRQARRRSRGIGRSGAGRLADADLFGGDDIPRSGRRAGGRGRGAGHPRREGKPGCGTVPAAWRRARWPSSGGSPTRFISGTGRCWSCSPSGWDATSPVATRRWRWRSPAPRLGLSTRFVEEPARRSRWPVAATWGGPRAGGGESRPRGRGSGDQQGATRPARPRVALGGRGHAGSRASIPVCADSGADRCAPTTGAIAVWGDSHAEHMVPAFQAVWRGPVLRFGRGGCPALPGLRIVRLAPGVAPTQAAVRRQPNDCRRINDTALAAIERRRDLRLVVLAGAWNLLWPGGAADHRGRPSTAGAGRQRSEHSRHPREPRPRTPTPNLGTAGPGPQGDAPGRYSQLRLRADRMRAAGLDVPPRSIGVPASRERARRRPLVRWRPAKNRGAHRRGDLPSDRKSLSERRVRPDLSRRLGLSFQQPHHPARGAGPRTRAGGAPAEPVTHTWRRTEHGSKGDAVARLAHNPCRDRPSGRS